MVMFEPFWVGYRTYYFYEFLSKDKRVAMSAAAAGGRVRISSPYQLSNPCCNLIDVCHDFITVLKGNGLPSLSWFVQVFVFGAMAPNSRWKEVGNKMRSAAINFALL